MGDPNRGMDGFRLSSPPMLRPSTNTGFSLVELVVVIAITGVIAGVVGSLIAGPVQGFFDQARRAELVDAAQLAVTRMSRDLRAALPNSVRLAGGSLEFLLTVDGERYRTETPGDDADRLDFAAPDTSFDTLAPLAAPTPLSTPYSFVGSLAIYPLMQAGADPWDPADGVMTAPGSFVVDRVSVAGADEYRITLPAAHRFPFDSPSRRVFAVSGPVTYRCAAGELLRYDGYSAAAVQSAMPGVTPVTLAQNVESCAFQYSAGTSERNAVVSLALVLEGGGERVRLLRQVHLDNTP